MATDREASLPIEDWDGVNLNVDSEDIQPSNLLSAQNLWEKTIGQLETRWGSETVAYKPAGVANNGLGNIFKVYKSWGERNRFCAIRCTPTVGVQTLLPTGISLAFVTSASSYWNAEITFGAGIEAGIKVDNRHSKVLLRFVGYGYDKIYSVATSAITGYVSGTRQLLRVTIASNFATDSGKITGVEVYAVVKCGDTETPAAITSSSNYQEQTMWVGFINLSPVVAQVVNYIWCPVGYDASIVSATSIGSNERSFAVSASVTGTNGLTGTFQGGKTYYVAILPQYTVFDGGVDNRCCYRNIDVDVFGGNIVPITIPGTTTGYITVDAIDPNSTCFMMAIGETPQTLQPYAIWNDSENETGAPDGTVPISAGAGAFYALNPTVNNPGVIDITYTAAGEATLSFRFSDYSRHDMFLGINDDDTYYPIFAGRLSRYTNDSLFAQDVVSSLTAAPNSGATYPWMWYSVNAMASMQRIGDGARYQFVHWQDYCLFVNDFDPVSLPTTQIASITYPVIASKTDTNYFICDGHVAAAVVEDFQSLSVPVALPNNKYIAKFDNSIVLGGGTPSIDPNNGGLNNSSKTLYFSRADNPFDFTIAGAAAPVHQTVSVADDGENISGFGIYTNTTSDQGPISQLFTLKKSATWIMNSLPDTAAGALTGFTHRLLSKKVGGFHATVVNTPIGAIMASHDNVYILREDGEPTPIGQNIAALIKASNMSKAVACYHDKHYKLSFSCPDFSGSQAGESNNVEMWLNINKVIEKKGAEDWVGPMVGRSIDFTLVEDKDGDGIAYDTARDRYCIDKYQTNGRIFRADVVPGTSDQVLYDRALVADGAAAPVVAVLGTKDLEITPQDNNWTKLIKRFYVKSRQNFVPPALPADTDYSWYRMFVDGVDETGLVAFDLGATAGVFYSKPLRLFGLVPQVAGVTARLNGRTVKFQFTFNHRIGIGGLQVNYQVNRRRI